MTGNALTSLDWLGGTAGDLCFDVCFASLFFSKLPRRAELHTLSVRLNKSCMKKMSRTRRILAADRRMHPGRSTVDEWIMFQHSIASSPDDFPTVEISFVRSVDGSGAAARHPPPSPLHATPHDYAVCAYYNDSHRLNSSGRRSARTGKRGSPALRAVFEEPKMVFGRFKPVLVTLYVLQLLLNPQQQPLWIGVDCSVIFIFCKIRYLMKHAYFSSRSVVV